MLVLTRFNKCEDTGAAKRGHVGGVAGTKWSFDQRIGLEKCRSSSGEDRGEDARLPVSTAN